MNRISRACLVVALTDHGIRARYSYGADRLARCVLAEVQSRFHSARVVGHRDQNHAVGDPDQRRFFLCSGCIVGCGGSLPSRPAPHRSGRHPWGADFVRHPVSVDAARRHSRSVPLLFAILLVGALGIPRFIFRLAKDHNFRPRHSANVLVVGAGRAGEMLVRDLIRQPDRKYSPVAFVDDNASKLGKEIHGVRVVGSPDDIACLVRDLSIDVILIALPSATGAEVRRIIERCEESGKPFRITPGSKT